MEKIKDQEQMTENNNKIIETLNKRTEGLKNDSKTEREETVSYTHLDVYKRQELIVTSDSIVHCN